jgi:hypothetical protein
MKTIIIYGFLGRFNGQPKYEYHHPIVDESHRSILFMLQDSQELDFEAATQECLRYGFCELDELSGNPVKVEVLSTDDYKGFAGFYEEALATGSSLVYYPNY